MNREQARYYAQMASVKAIDAPAKLAVQQLIEDSKKLDQIERILKNRHVPSGTPYVITEIMQILEIEPWEKINCTLDSWKPMN